MTAKELHSICQEDVDETRLPVGLCYESVEPEYIHTRNMNILGFVGNSGGKKAFLHYIFSSLSKRNVCLYMLDDTLGSFMYTRNYPQTALYIPGTEDTLALWERFDQLILERTQKLQQNQTMDDEAFHLIVIQSPDCLNDISKNRDYMDVCKQIIAQGSTLKMGIWLSNIDSSTVGYSAPELVKLLRDKKQVFLFNNLEEQKMFDIPMSVIRNNKKNLSEGDAYLLMGGAVKRMKTVTVQN